MLTGFIGQSLLKFIEKDYEIVLLSSSINENYKTVLHKNYTFNKQDFEKNGILKVDIGAFIPKSGIEANIFNTKYLFF